MIRICSLCEADLKQNPQTTNSSDSTTDAIVSRGQKIVNDEMYVETDTDSDKENDLEQLEQSQYFDEENNTLLIIDKKAYTNIEKDKKAILYWHQRFTLNTFGSACLVCDRL